MENFIKEDQFKFESEEVCSSKLEFCMDEVSKRNDLFTGAEAILTFPIIATDKAEDMIHDEEFVVEAIVGKGRIGGILHYKVKWKDYDDSANSWEPATNLYRCKSLIDEFNKRKKAKATVCKGKQVKPKNNVAKDIEVTPFTSGASGVNAVPGTTKCLTLITEWPADKVPISVEGVCRLDGGELAYIVKRETRLARIGESG